MSTGSYPTLTSSVTVVNWLLDKLEDVNSQEHPDKIKKAAYAAIQKLKQYYAKMEAPAYAVALSMSYLDNLIMFF